MRLTRITALLAAILRTATGWQIGAIADNRGTTAFAGAPTAPAD
jgi:hypothetical protein